MSKKKSNRVKITADVLALLREQSTQTVLFHAAIAEQLGLHPTDHKSLDLVAKAGRLTAGQLAQSTRLTTGAITGVIDRLEKSGFVRRTFDANDRRRILVELEPDTMARMSQVFAPIRKRTETLLKKYSDEELSLIADFLEQSIALTATTSLVSTKPL